MKRQYSNGLQIIGAGFGRSGTMSLRKALETLGYKPCYHFQVMLFHYPHMKFWLNAQRGKPVDYRHFFRRYKATVDWPACEFYQELMEIYPDAKVLLNVRDPEKWYDSMYNSIWAIQPVFRRSFLQRVRKVHDEIMWDSRFQGEFENREKATAIYKERIEEIKRTVPSERLLVYDVKEGWDPLCRFLDVPVPEGLPFPRLNDRKKFRKLILLLKILEWLVPLVILAALVFIGVLVF